MIQSTYNNSLNCVFGRQIKQQQIEQNNDISFQLPSSRLKPPPSTLLQSQDREQIKEDDRVTKITGKSSSSIKKYARNTSLPPRLERNQKLWKNVQKPVQRSQIIQSQKKRPRIQSSSSSTQSSSQSYSQNPIKPQAYKIPTNLTITPQIMAQRKYLNNYRWYCISRPQYQRNCGLASLTSCWNYLFSPLGNQSVTSVLSQEEIMTILNFKPPFDEIKFGSFTGNDRLLIWFRQLLKHFDVKGECGYYFKLVGKAKSQAIYTKPNDALQNMKNDLRQDNMSLIYHCYNHYFCPIGYQSTPICQWEAYQSNIEGGTEQAILVGDCSKKFRNIQSILWDDVAKDLSLVNPKFFDVRRPHQGVQNKLCGESGGVKVSEIFAKKNNKNSGNNCHCFLYFKRCE